MEVQRFCFETDDYYYSSQKKESQNRLITAEEVEGILNKYENIGDGGTRLRIQKLEWYQKAFVHKSFLIHGDSSLGYIPMESNECLEFGGDSTLGDVVARYLLKRFQGEQEGFLTKLRARLVRSNMLSEFAVALGFREFLLVSPQVEAQIVVGATKGRDNPRLYEDAFEAFIGAIRDDFDEDTGYKYARRFITSIITHHIDFAHLISVNENHKDTLQRYFQSRRWSNPVYEDVDGLLAPAGGPKQFSRGLSVPMSLLRGSFSKEIVASCTQYHIENHPESPKDMVLIGRGVSFRKTEAEQHASRMALLNLGIGLDF